MNLDALSKKYGPLPGSVWLLLIFCGVFLLIKSRQSKASATQQNTGPAAHPFISGQDNKVGFTTSSSVDQTWNYNGDGAQYDFSNNAGSGSNNVVTSPAPVAVVQPLPAHHRSTSPDVGHRHHYRHDSHDERGRRNGRD